MVCILGVVFGVFGAGEPIIGVFALAAYFAPARLARSTKNGRELLPMLKYSSQAQLLIGAALTMSMGLNLYWR